MGGFSDLPGNSFGTPSSELEKRTGDGLRPRPLCLKERVEELESTGEMAPGLG